jgi:hypothetical protein
MCTVFLHRILGASAEEQGQNKEIGLWRQKKHAGNVRVVRRLLLFSSSACRK